MLYHRSDTLTIVYIKSDMNMMSSFHVDADLADVFMSRDVSRRDVSHVTLGTADRQFRRVTSSCLSSVISAAAWAADRVMQYLLLRDPCSSDSVQRKHIRQQYSLSTAADC